MVRRPSSSYGLGIRTEFCGRDLCICCPPIETERVAELVVAACLALLALIWPVQLAHAAPQVPITVDHPAADGVTSFDSGQRSSRLVALTFDADMTPGMLALLRRGSVQS